MKFFFFFLFKYGWITAQLLIDKTIQLRIIKELDEKSLLEKATYVWTEWTRTDDFYDKTRNSMVSSALNCFFLFLR